MTNTGNMGEEWLNTVLRAKKSCQVDGNHKRVHYAFETGREMVEEYNMETECLVKRAWKRQRKLYVSDDWEIEIGEPIVKDVTRSEDLLVPCTGEPYVTSRMTRRNIEWRIRNLEYPIETYSVTADSEKKSIILRTTNNKYFKVIRMLDLERVNLVPVQENISFTHKFHTLIITYKKPKELLDVEKIVMEEVKKLQPQRNPVFDECKTS